MERILISEGGVPVCEIAIGEGLLSEGRRVLHSSSKAIAVGIFTQDSVSHVAESISQMLEGEGVRRALRVLPDRDSSKTLSVAEECFRWLNDLALTRSDAIVGIGGGALTDIAGFIAGTYLRGIDAVFVPTTLLGAIDASIGGKSAVNVDGKNLVGVFRHPKRVIIDLGVLENLPIALRREGSAEAVKAGFIADPEIVGIYERNGLGAPLYEIVTRAVAVKAAIVSADFREAESRMFLNFGHTVGHAVETLTGIAHGDAIAIGMSAAAEASRRLTGFSGSDRLRAVIESLGLPVLAESGTRMQIRRLMELDKKRDQSGLRMVLLEEFGRPVVLPVDDVTVDAALAAIGIE